MKKAGFETRQRVDLDRQRDREAESRHLKVALGGLHKVLHRLKVDIGARERTPYVIRGIKQRDSTEQGGDTRW